MAVDGSSALMQTAAEEGTLTMSTQASKKARLYTCLGTVGLGGMIHWHNALRLEVQSMSPFMHAHKCQSEWSSNGLERKWSIPLALCMLELLE